MNKSNTIKLVLSIVVCQLAGAIGSVFTTSSIDTWYANLVRSPLAPPNWVFGPVWTTLYLLMGIALFLVWKKGSEVGYDATTKKALKIFFVQLVLNSAWSIVFFGMHNIGGALIVILVLWLSIIATMWQFRKVSKATLWLLLPYLLWVSFASFLNYSIWTLN